MALPLVELIYFWTVLRIDSNKEGFPSFCA